MKKTLARCRNPLAFLLAVLLLLSLAGCGGGYNGDDTGGYSYKDYDAEEAADTYATLYNDGELVFSNERGYGGAALGMTTASSLLSAPAAQTEAPSTKAASDPTLPRKLVRRASLTMETTTFDESTAALSDLVASLDGYFSDAGVGDQNGSRKRANYTIRIPAKNFDTFLSAVGDICHETWRSVTQDDISERYYDTAGRLRTQNTKLARLQELLTKAENMEDIITIQSAISDTEERIEELQGTLSHWDNQVDYATIDLSLTEVYRLSNTPPVPETFLTRLGSAFTDGVTDFAEWVGDLIISLAYSWLWWLLLVLVVLGILRIRKTQWWQKKREEREKRRAARQTRYVYHGGPLGWMRQNGTRSETRSETRPETPSDADKQEKGGE